MNIATDDRVFQGSLSRSQAWPMDDGRVLQYQGIGLEQHSDGTYRGGFYCSQCSALDKQQGSFKAVTTPTAVKQDLVISAYKPNGGFEERFQKEAQTEEGVWDFVRTHLKYLPVIKRQSKCDAC